MAELTVRFDLSFGTRSLRCLMVAAMIFSAVSEVASESVTLTTYYPAPSGVYTQMIVTTNAYLARDSGSVGIGTASPTQKLEVNGGVQVDGAGINNAFGSQLVETDANDWTRWNQGSGATNGNAMYQSLSLGTGGLAVGTWSNQAAGNIYATGIVQVAGAGSSYIQGKLGVGNASPQQVLDVSGTAQAVDLVASDSVCSEVQFLVDGVTNCPAGEYATATSGVISDMTEMPLYTLTAFGSSGASSSATAPMLCCNCPAAGCPSLP